MESVKAVSEIYMPVGGEVLEVNASLNDSPELVNKEPYGRGWMILLRPSDPSELDGLMTNEQYLEYLRSQS